MSHHCLSISQKPSTYLSIFLSGGPNRGSDAHHCFINKMSTFDGNPDNNQTWKFRFSGTGWKSWLCGCINRVHMGNVYLHIRRKTVYCTLWNKISVSSFVLELKSVNTNTLHEKNKFLISHITAGGYHQEDDTLSRISLATKRSFLWNRGDFLVSLFSPDKTKSHNGIVTFVSVTWFSPDIYFRVVCPPLSLKPYWLHWGNGDGQKHGMKCI